jgi:retinoblastoma-like protein 1
VGASRNLSIHFDSSNLIPTTPLSGKHYLRAKEQLKVTPVSTATYLVSRLTTLLAKRNPEPSPKLEELLQSRTPNPTEAIIARIKNLGDTFCQHYVAASNGHPGSHDSFARTRLKLGVTLYFKLLETILFTEKAKNKPLTNLLDQDLFHQALFACCLEIVIFSYNSQRTFPWILDTFVLEAIHFYKVIEVIMRAVNA